MPGISVALLILDDQDEIAKLAFRHAMIIEPTAQNLFKQYTAVRMLEEFEWDNLRFLAGFSGFMPRVFFKIFRQRLEVQKVSFEDMLDEYTRGNRTERPKNETFNGVFEIPEIPD